MIRNDEIEKRLTAHAAHAQPFRPGLHCDPDGDCLEFVAAPDDFYAERVDELLTVYYSRRTGDVCGALLKGWSKFQKEVLKRFPGFVIEVQDGKVPLVLVFRARLWSQPPNEIPGLVYKKLIDVAISSEVEAEIQTA